MAGESVKVHRYKTPARRRCSASGLLQRGGGLDGLILVTINSPADLTCSADAAAQCRARSMSRPTNRASTRAASIVSRCLCERAVDRTPCDAETLRDRRGTQLGPQLLDLRRIGHVSSSMGRKPEARYRSVAAGRDAHTTMPSPAWGSRRCSTAAATVLWSTWTPIPGTSTGRSSASQFRVARWWLR